MRHFLIFFFFVFQVANAQDYAREWTIQLSASTQANSTHLSWENNLNTSANTYKIYRRTLGSSNWGIALASLPSTVLNYTDSTTNSNTSYEYKLEKVNGNTVYAWGYINASHELQLEINKGDFLLVVDSTFVNGLVNEIQSLENDLYMDGYRVRVIYVDRLSSPTHVKSRIAAEYNNLQDLQTIYLLGHVPVPYSGNLNPDAHPDHKGAWPADLYYGDIDGNWTDNTVNTTVANDSRNHNIPGDGKFDQSTIPSALECVVSRVDFHNLNSFSNSEEELLRNYLNKAHQFKVGQLTAEERGLIDQGNFTSYQEGFAQNGFRNFMPFFGSNGVEELDYFSTLDNGASYLWSYGCGGGSYTSANGLNNGSAVTSSQFANGHVKTIFTMLFGSYFGDWDKDNNLMRSCLASGDVLSISWAGRPNWHYHTMASGEAIGKSALMSMDYNSDYWSIGLSGLVTGEGVHVSLLGDPSLRMYYVSPPSNISVSNVGYPEINWSASNDPQLAGYDIFRKASTETEWTKINSSLVQSNTYSDINNTDVGNYEYMVKAVKLKVNNSGSHYASSLGSSSSYDAFLNIDNKTIEMNIYPNPTKGIFNVDSDHVIKVVHAFDLQGRQLELNFINQDKTRFQLQNKGVYLVQFTFENGEQAIQRLVVN